MRHLIKALILLAAQSADADTSALGRDLFLDGDGAEVLLLDGTLKLSARRFACAGCHGKDALGDHEGATDFPAIDWATLGAESGDGLRYSAASLAVALRDGIAPDGRHFSDAMPRYIASDEVIGSLVTYLTEIGADQKRGITPAIVFISAAPDSAGWAGLQLAVDMINAEGGAFGRMLRLARPDAAMMTDTALSALLDPLIDEAEARQKLQLMRGFAGDVDEYTVYLRADIMAPAQQKSLPKPVLRALLHGLILGDALIDCGRGVTRHCVESFFESVTIEGYLALYQQAR